MDHWVEKLKEIDQTTAYLHQINPVKFEQLTINLTRKYVNDVLFAGQGLRLGTFWDPTTKSLMWSLEKEDLDKAQNHTNDTRTMEIVAEISSQILDCLNFTWDSPPKNKNMKMPVLDTQMWVQTESREKKVQEQMGENVGKVLKNHSLKKIIFYEFYKTTNGQPLPKPAMFWYP